MVAGAAAGAPDGGSRETESGWADADGQEQVEERAQVQREPQILIVVDDDGDGWVADAVVLAGE